MCRASKYTLGHRSGQRRPPPCRCARSAVCVTHPGAQAPRDAARFCSSSSRVAAYLAAHVVVDWLGAAVSRRVGRRVPRCSASCSGRASPGCSRPRSWTRFAPVTTLALGWMGAAVGMRLHLAELVKVPGITFRLALAESALTFLFVGGDGDGRDRRGCTRSPLVEAALPAAALAGIATASSSAGVELAARRLNERGVEVTQLGVSVLRERHRRGGVVRAARQRLAPPGAGGRPADHRHGMDGDHARHRRRRRRAVPSLRRRRARHATASSSRSPAA